MAAKDKEKDGEEKDGEDGGEYKYGSKKRRKKVCK